MLSSLLLFNACWPLSTGVIAGGDGAGEDEKEQLACIMEIMGPPPPSLIQGAPRASLFFNTGWRPCTAALLGCAAGGHVLGKLALACLRGILVPRLAMHSWVSFRLRRRQGLTRSLLGTRSSVSIQEPQPLVHRHSCHLVQALDPRCRARPTRAARRTGQAP